MPDWLFSGRPTVYILLGAIAVVMLYQAWLRRHPKLRRTARPFAAVGVLALALIVGYWLLDRAVVTDREQIVERLQAMAASVRDSNLDAVEQYLSDQFRTPGGMGKTRFLELARDQRRLARVEEVIVWDFYFPESVSRDGPVAHMSFQVKARGELGRARDIFYRCEADFDFSPAEGWRLRSFQLFDPMKENERVPLPF